MAHYPSSDSYKAGISSRFYPYVHILPSPANITERGVGLPGRKSNFETLPCNKARTIFPLGIVRGYDFEDDEMRESIEEAKRRIAREESVSLDCLYSSSANKHNALRWGQQVKQSRLPTEEGEDSASLNSSFGRTKCKFVRTRSRSHSTDALVYNPRANPNFSAITVKAKSFQLVNRPKTTPTAFERSTFQPTKISQQARTRSSEKRERVEGVRPQSKVSATTFDDKNIENDVETIKIDEGLVLIKNGKIVSLKLEVKKRRGLKKQTKIGSNEIRAIECVREFNDSMGELKKATSKSSTTS